MTTTQITFAQKQAAAVALRYLPIFSAEREAAAQVVAAYSNQLPSSLRNVWRRACLEACADRRQFSEITTRRLHKFWDGRMTALKV